MSLKVRGLTYIFSISSVVIAFFAPVYAPSQSSSNHHPLVAHGTINALLGNSNGLVVMTDSNLTDSNGKLYPQQAPKLFRLDDTTVCTIAGYYFNFGPEFEQSYPVSALVSRVVDQYLRGSAKRDLSIDQKTDFLVRLFQFSLALTENTVLASQGLHDLAPEPSSMYLTVAGYEGGKITVKQVLLRPRLKRSLGVRT